MSSTEVAVVCAAHSIRSDGYATTTLKSGLAKHPGRYPPKIGAVGLPLLRWTANSLAKLDNRFMIRLLVGLGNPGPEYEMTRHNAGFWFIEEAVRVLGVSLQPERSYFGLVARVNHTTGPIWLLEPMTFMNLSGKSVAALSRFFKLTPNEILIAHDELDLSPGQVKIKCGGSHAGHNGLKDIQAQLGSGDFWRLRLGIGHPGVRAEVIDYVLRKPPREQRDAINANIDQAVSAIGSLLEGDMTRATATIHARPPRPRPPPPTPGAPDDQPALRKPEV